MVAFRRDSPVFCKHFIALCGVVLCVLAPVLTGCEPEQDTFFEKHFLQSASLELQPETLQVDPPPHAGDIVIMGGLRLVLPRSWSCAVGQGFEYGASSEFAQGWAARLEVPYGGERVQIQLLYSEGRGYLSDQPEEFMEIVRKASSQPQRFLSGFDTDMQLFEAANEVLPRDYLKVSGRKRELARALLYLKRYRMVPIGWRITLPRLQGFLHRMEGAPPRVYADLFDHAGKYCGMLYLTFPDALPVEGSEMLAAQMLYHSRPSSAP